MKTAETKPKFEFVANDTDTVFHAVLESYTHPEASWFQWVLGLPEALRVPDASFRTTKGPGMFHLGVCSDTKTNEIITRDDGSVLCQITAVISQAVIETWGRRRRNPDDDLCAREWCRHPRSAHYAGKGECNRYDKCRDPNCGCGKDDKGCNCREFQEPTEEESTT